MNDNPPADGSRGPDPSSRLRLVALGAAIVGVMLLAAAAFVLSYGGIHQLARQAGMSANMARLFPLIFDAMLVVSCAAVLSLRGGSWWRRGYAWLVTLVLLVAVAAGDAVHATGTHLPRRPSAATAAVLPWALLLIAFSLLLAMLRQFRHYRAAVARQDAGAPAAAAAASPAVIVTRPTGAGTPRTTLDDLLMEEIRKPSAAATVPVAAAPADVARRGIPGMDRTGPGGVTADRTTTSQATAAPAPVSAPRNAAADTSRDGTPAGPRDGTAGAPDSPTAPSETARPAADTPATPNSQVTTQPIGPDAGATKSAARALDAAEPADSDTPAGQEPATGEEPATEQGPTDQEPSAETPAGDTPAGETATDETPGVEAVTDETPTSETAPGEAGEAAPGEAAPDKPTGDQPDSDEPAGDQPATGPGSGTAQVPYQPMRAPVPAPSPHFDRLRSMPTPPDEDDDSDS